MGLREPTWRMVDGVSTESLALEVARTCALPPSILRRANSLYQARPRYAHTQPSWHESPQYISCAMPARWTDMLSLRFCNA